MVKREIFSDLSLPLHFAAAKDSDRLVALLDCRMKRDFIKTL